MYNFLNDSKKESDKIQKNRKKLTRKAKRIISISLILSLFSAFAVSILVSNFSIKVTTESITTKKITSPMTVAIISDLHTKSFGENNKKLIDKVAKQNPDVILMPGDITSDNSTESKNIEYLENLISKLSNIAPVYFSIGNHERHNPNLDSMISAISQSGGIVLDADYIDTTINGNPVRIGGISYHRSWDEKSNAYLSDFTSVSKDTYTLLLCHCPEFYLWGIRNYNIDLIASGHTHGGMVNVPLKGPLYAPEQGWFPEYAKGLYETDCKGYLAITTGLASSPEYLPRIFNRPEIMIVEIE